MTSRGVHGVASPVLAFFYRTGPDVRQRPEPCGGAPVATDYLL
jgi:hypothetical protein